MRRRPPIGDQSVADRSWERQIGKGSVQVSQLAASDAEFNTAKAVLMDRHPFPFGDHVANDFARANHVATFTYIVSAIHRPHLLS